MCIRDRISAIGNQPAAKFIQDDDLRAAGYIKVASDIDDVGIGVGGQLEVIGGTGFGQSTGNGQCSSRTGTARSDGAAGNRVKRSINSSAAADGLTGIKRQRWVRVTGNIQNLSLIHI